MAESIPVSRIDLYTEEALLNPYPLYQELRDAGPVVSLEQYGVLFIARYKDVKEALRNWQVFTSSQGVAVADSANLAQRGNLIASDPPRHDQLRRILGRPLLPAAMRELSQKIVSESEALCDRLLEMRSFDAVSDLAWHLPLTVVTQLIGMPEDVQAKWPSWGAAVFNLIGPENERATRCLPAMMEMVGCVLDPELGQRLRPGGWGALLFEAAERGEIEPSIAPILLLDYLGPSLDTTASAIGSAIWLLGQHPAQWDEIVEDPALISNAVLETIRMETPIPSFCREVVTDSEVDGVPIMAGSRVLVSYASGNRDERKWNEPERFDIRRKVSDHLAFGHGVHTCMGMHLAQLEARSLLGALAKRVKRFEIGTAVHAPNNGLRSLSSLPVTVVPL